MGQFDEPSSLVALIEAHKAALAQWDAVSRQIQYARRVHDELEKAHEASNAAERLALSALMAHPVESLDEARLKAAYFLDIDHVRDFADEITLAFMRSLADDDEK